MTFCAQNRDFENSWVPLNFVKVNFVMGVMVALDNERKRARTTIEMADRVRAKWTQTDELKIDHHPAI
jgi:hypothetical protein